MITVKEIGKNACAAKREAVRLTTGKKNEVLLKAAAMLREHAPEIIAANEKDMETARANGMPVSLQDRLALNE